MASQIGAKVKVPIPLPQRHIPDKKVCLNVLFYSKVSAIINCVAPASPTHRVYLPIARNLRLLKNCTAPPTEVYLPIDRDLRLLQNGAAPPTESIFTYSNGSTLVKEWCCSYYREYFYLLRVSYACCRTVLFLWR